MSGARAIVFVTDFGLESEWVGICHAVMCKVAPESRVIDLSHFIEPLDVEAGARMLSDSLDYLPDDAVVLAVVDPNVGKDRDIAVETGNGRVLVGPDNGLLSSTWAASGGARRAVEITSPDVILGPVVAVLPRPRRPLPGGRAPGSRDAARAARRGARPGRRSSASSSAGRRSSREDPLRGDRPQPLREHPAQRPQAGPRRRRARRRRRGSRSKASRAGSRRAAARRSPTSSPASTA